MVVVSIISFMSSIVSTRVTVARAKAVDVARTQTVIQTSNAIKAYTLDKGAPPANFKGSEIAYSSDSPLPDGSGLNAFQKSMKVLVDNKYLSKIPETTGGIPFIYYDYGQPTGAVFGTTLSTVSAIANNNNCRINTAPTEAQCTILISRAFGAFPSCSSPGQIGCIEWTTADVINLSQCPPYGYMWVSIFLCKDSQGTLDAYGFGNVSHSGIQPLCANGGNFPGGVCSTSNDFCMCTGF